MESRLEAVELKFMDVEVTIEQLNEVIIRQQNTIDRLTSTVEQLQGQMRSVSSIIAKESDETPPPHY